MRSLPQRLARSIPAIDDWARRAWCCRQRRRLVGVTTTIIWAPPDEVPWALWGAPAVRARPLNGTLGESPAKRSSKSGAGLDGGSWKLRVYIPWKLPVFA